LESITHIYQGDRGIFEVMHWTMIQASCAQNIKAC
jgi:hypothetical protein